MVQSAGDWHVDALALVDMFSFEVTFLRKAVIKFDGWLFAGHQFSHSVFCCFEFDY